MDTGGIVIQIQMRHLNLNQLYLYHPCIKELQLLAAKIPQ